MTYYLLYLEMLLAGIQEETLVILSSNDPEGNPVINFSWQISKK